MMRSMGAAFCLVATPVLAAPADAPTQIMAAMEASAAGWNAGDLDRFMAVYANDAIFVTKDALLKSRAEIAARYRPSFVDGRNVRGKLAFRPLAFKTLSAVHLILYARYTLTPGGSDAKPESGMTTLVFERRPEGWRIISDNS